MSGGWISGFAYAALMIRDALVMGLRFVFVTTPWQRDLRSSSIAAFVGLAGESVIIDSDHWRHYFLLLGAALGA